MEHQRQLSLKQIKESEENEQNAELSKNLSPEQQQAIKTARANLVTSDMEAWKFLLEFHRISDEDIKKIIQGLNDPSSDDARRAILKIYSYETPIYSQMNQANMRQDRNAIPTLGPFALLLWMALCWPP